MGPVVPMRHVSRETLSETLSSSDVSSSNAKAGIWCILLSGLVMFGPCSIPVDWQGHGSIASVQSQQRAEPGDLGKFPG